MKKCPSQSTTLVKLLATSSLILTCQICMATDPIRILTWNLEGRVGETTEIIDKLKQLKENTEIIALADVPMSAIDPIAEALDWKHFASGSDKGLMIAWSSRFSKLRLKRSLTRMSKTRSTKRIVRQFLLAYSIESIKIL